MIEPAAGETKAGRDIFRFEIRQFFENLLLSEPSRKKIEHVDHPNPHSTDTRPSSALCKIRSDALDKFSHDENLRERSFPLAPCLC